MKIINKSLFLCFIILSIFSSCTERQDFDQIGDVEITPTIEGSILFFESPENIVNLVTGQDFFSRIFNFDAFQESFFERRLLDGVITYQIENTTSKELEVIIEFLDEGDNSLDLESFTIQPAPTSVLQREIAYGTATGRSIDIIKNTSSIRVSARNLGDNTSVSNLPEPKIILRSSGKFRIELVK